MTVGVSKYLRKAVSNYTYHAHCTVCFKHIHICLTNVLNTKSFQVLVDIGCLHKFRLPLHIFYFTMLCKERMHPLLGESYQAAFGNKSSLSSQVIASSWPTRYLLYTVRRVGWKLENLWNLSQKHLQQTRLQHSRNFSNSQSSNAESNSLFKKISRPDDISTELLSMSHEHQFPIDSKGAINGVVLNWQAKRKRKQAEDPGNFRRQQISTDEECMVSL